MPKVLTAKVVGNHYELSWYVGTNKALFGSILQKVKMIPNRAFDPSTKKWMVPITPRNNELITQIGFRIKESKKKKGSPPQTEAVQKKITANPPTRWKTLKPIGIPSKARDYQSDGIKQMAQWDYNCLQADEPGLGKTLQSIASVSSLEKFPVLIVCPATLKLNWEREINMWSRKKHSIFVVEGKTITEDYRDYEYVVINYSILWDHLEYILKHLKPKVFIADEVHVLKSTGTLVGKYYLGYKLKHDEFIRQDSDIRRVYKLPPKRVRASLWITTGLPPDMQERTGIKWNGLEHKILLTGTPIQNHNGDLFNILHMLYPKKYADISKFLEYFCEFGDGFKAGSRKIIGSKNSEMLHKILIENHMVRRTKEEVLPELPPLQKTIIPIRLSPSYRREYDKAEEDINSWIKDNKNKKLHSEEQQRSTRFRTLLDLARDGKLQECYSFIDDLISDGKKKIIVFAYHQKVIKELSARYGKKSVVLYGETSLVNKQDAVDSFQTDPKIQVFIGQIESASVGITLTKAETVVFVETGFMAHIVSQAIDRSRRLGTTADKIQAFFLQAHNTIERLILKKLDMKAQAIKKVTDGVDIGQEDLLDFLYEEYEKKIELEKRKEEDKSLEKYSL